MSRMISKFNYFSTRTPKRKSPTAVTLNRTLNYLQYGRYSRHLPRGEWLGPEGETNYAEVQAWSRAQIESYPLAYHLILSPREGQPVPAWFNEVVQQTELLADWRLIAHHDTAHPHTHCLFFADAVWSREQIQTWHQQIAVVMDRLTQREVDLAPDLDIAPHLPPPLDPTLSALADELAIASKEEGWAEELQEKAYLTEEEALEEEWDWGLGW